MLPAHRFVKSLTVTCLYFLHNLKPLQVLPYHHAPSVHLPPCRLLPVSMRPGNSETPNELQDKRSLEDREEWRELRIDGQSPPEQGGSNHVPLLFPYSTRMRTYRWSFIQFYPVNISPTRTTLLWRVLKIDKWNASFSRTLRVFLNFLGYRSLLKQHN